ncbi:PPOX class F420-dependent oxidoreductase [Agromyces sp. H3Y2-19a]|uniref:PPOX class F420-dependent oxidoreductase n=1 Tax=Agromyces TaxID=33877 RepID=UPI001E41F725|nr:MULTISPECIES: PPOX class F420-dependent oxidoreductase [Agromyces]MCD5345949.1 PPOX class F420-dependent oxidoreductase [Agromyces sp. S2-1-8]MDF0512317.1 PPOX class F420-dependent oxidoreductase [Agromyces chromiiresistens]
MTKNAGPVPLTEAEASDLLAAQNFGVLATLKRDGQPHLTTMLYGWDASAGVARFSTTSTRLKATHLRRNPRATLHVSADDHWSYAAVEGLAEVSAPTVEPGDAVGRELLALVPEAARPADPSDFFDEAVAEGRVVIRLRAERLGGTRLDFGN